MLFNDIILNPEFFPRNSKCAPHFGIYDTNGTCIYDMWGPVCPCQCVCGCTDDVKFPMRSVADNSVVGNISKIWAGAMREMFTQADTFGVTCKFSLADIVTQLIFT